MNVFGGEITNQDLTSSIACADVRFLDSQPSSSCGSSEEKHGLGGRPSFLSGCVCFQGVSAPARSFKPKHFFKPSHSLLTEFLSPIATLQTRIDELSL